MIGEHILKFNHIFKLDPNRYISETQINLLCNSGSDAIIVGGTLNVTYDDTVRLLHEIRKYSITAIQEISDINAIVPGFDYYFIPLVLNAQNPDLIFNAHQKAIKKYADLIDWKQVVLEGYIVLNENSSVARITKSHTNLQLEDVIAYGVMADKMLGLPIVYLEYSGVYGNSDWVRRLSSNIEDANLYYGGGINSLEKAQEMSKYADTIIIGNLIYEDFDLALLTVKI